jgi:hypothetical protein
MKHVVGTVLINAQDSTYTWWAGLLRTTSMVLIKLCDLDHLLPTQLGVKDLGLHWQILLFMSKPCYMSSHGWAAQLCYVS